MSNPFPPGPNGPQQPNQGWNQQPGQPQQPQQGWGQQPGQPQGGFPPGGFPQGGQPGFYGGPPPPPPRKSKIKRIVIPIVVLAGLVIAGTVARNALSKDDVTGAKPGSCFGTMKGGPISSKESPKIVDCTSPSAKWKTLHKFGDSSASDKCEAIKGYVASYEWTGKGKGTLCLGFTANTTLADAKAFDPTGTIMLKQSDFEALTKEKGIDVPPTP
ncbi:hypothetical protein [Embleya sp. NPDC020886]|uniref:LppU/SCO3897 family protein n=1 Tax=Embleya sp. NPDC020886 TaxID=3363980 RepID=UPI003797DE00